MAQNEVQVKVTSEISNAKSYENDMKRIAKQRLDEINELKRAEKISAEQLADLKQRLNSETFDKEKQQAMRMHKLRVDNAKKENSLLSSFKSGAKEGLGKAWDLVKKGGAAVVGGTAAGVAYGASKYEDIEVAKKVGASLVDGLNEEAYTATAKRIAGTTTFNELDIYNGLNSLFQRGLSEQQAYAAADPIAKFAMANRKGFDEVAPFAINLINSIGATVDDLPKIFDIMTKSGVSSSLDYDTLSQFLNKSAVGLKFKDIDFSSQAAMASVLADKGRYGSEAGTAVNSILKYMSKEGAQKILSSYGVSSVDKNGNWRDPVEIMNEFVTALENSGKSQVEQANELSKVAGEFTNEFLILASGAKRYQELSQLYKGAGGETDRQANAMMDTTKGQRGIMMEAFAGFFTDIASKLNLKEIYKGITEGLNKAWNKLKPMFETVSKAIEANVPLIKENASKLAEAFATGFVTSVTIALNLLPAISNVLLSIYNLLSNAPMFKDMAERANSTAIIDSTTGLATKNKKDAEKWFASIVGNKLGRDVTTEEAMANFKTFMPMLTKAEAEEFFNILSKAESSNNKAALDILDYRDEGLKNGNVTNKTNSELLKASSIATQNAQNLRTMQDMVVMWYGEDVKKRRNDEYNNEPAKPENNQHGQPEKLFGDLENYVTQNGVEQPVQQQQQVTSPSESTAFMDAVYKEFQEVYGVSKEALDSYLNGTYELKKQFGTTAGFGAYEQYDFNALGVDQKQLDELQRIREGLDDLNRSMNVVNASVQGFQQQESIEIFN